MSLPTSDTIDNARWTHWDRNSPDRVHDCTKIEPRFRELLESIYERHCAGCCLHVVLDDWNLEDIFLQDEEWRDIEHDDCLEMRNLLRRLSYTQRRKLLARGHRFRQLNRVAKTREKMERAYAFWRQDPNRRDVN